MDASAFFSRVNSIRQALGMESFEVPQTQELDTYLVHRAPLEKEIKANQNCSFSAPVDTLTTEQRQSDSLQEEANLRKDQLRIEELESQLREWMTMSKQKEDDVVQRYEQTIDSLKSHYNSLASFYETKAKEQLQSFSEKHEKEITELKRNLEAAEARIRDNKKTIAEQESALEKSSASLTNTNSLLEDAKTAISRVKSELKTVQDSLQRSESENQSLRTQLTQAHDLIHDTELTLSTTKRDLAQAKSKENQVSGEMETLQKEVKTKTELISELKTELAEQMKEVEQLLETSRELTEQRSSEREFIKQYKEEIDGLENLKFQLEKETAELAAQKQQFINEYMEEYEERYSKAVSVAEMWKARSDFTLAKFYTFTRTLRLELITLKNEVVNWQEAALTDFTKTVAQITRRYKYMLEDSQEVALGLAEKVKKLKKTKKTALF